MGQNLCTQADKDQNSGMDLNIRNNIFERTSNDFSSILNSMHILKFIMNDIFLNQLFEIDVQNHPSYSDIYYFNNLKTHEMSKSNKFIINELTQIFKQYEFKSILPKKINLSEFIYLQQNAIRTNIHEYIDKKNIINGIISAQYLPTFINKIQDKNHVFKTLNQNYFVKTPYEWLLSMTPIFDELPFPICVTDDKRDNIITFVNKEFTKNTGYSEFECMNKPIHFTQQDIIKHKTFDKNIVLNKNKSGEQIIHFTCAKPIYFCKLQNEIVFNIVLFMNPSKHIIHLCQTIFKHIPNYMFDVKIKLKHKNH